MQDIAEAIVKRARMLPLDTGVELCCNGAVIKKVKVTGGFGLQVSSKDETSLLLFPMAEMEMATLSFLTTARKTATDMEGKNFPSVHRANGLPLLSFEWNNTKAREGARRSVSRLLLNPPLCRDMQTAAETSVAFDARGREGWDIGSVSEPPNASTDEESGEED